MYTILLIWQRPWKRVRFVHFVLSLFSDLQSAIFGASEKSIKSYLGKHGTRGTWNAGKFLQFIPTSSKYFFVHVNDWFVDASSVLTLGNYSILTGQSTTRRYATSNSEASQLQQNAHSQSSWGPEHSHNQSRYNIRFGCLVWCFWCHTLCGKLFLQLFLAILVNQCYLAGVPW